MVSDTRIPHELMRVFRISRLVALSSTISTRTLSRSAGRAFSVDIASDCFSKRAVNQNSDPTPSLLVTPTSPPINSANCLEIARPRPVPPNLRVVAASTCVNSSKSSPILSPGIPMPVSRTEKRNMTPPSLEYSTVTPTVTSPASVNLIAFPVRLVRICRNRPGSPRSNSGTSVDIPQNNSSPFSCACTASVAAKSSSSLCRSKSRISKSSLPASIFEKSRMSLIRLSND